MKKTYVLKNLGCAHCAAEMEAKINELPGVESATVDFASARLLLTAREEENWQERLQSVCTAIEPGVEVIEKTDSKKISGKSPAFNLSQFEVAQLGLGIGLFIIGLLEFLPQNYDFVLFFVAYLLLGGGIVWKALRNLARGEFFDESFLMTIATAGAFIIKEYPEAVGVMLFYRIGEYFEQRAVTSTRERIMEAVDLRPETVRLVDGEAIKNIPIGEAELGDILLVRPGDRIPLDGIIVTGESRIDTSPVTGEPVPVRATSGSQVVSGCINTSGLLKLRVEKELEDSMVSRILDSVENALVTKPKLDRLITRFARIYTPIVVTVALVTALVPGYLTGDWEKWVYTALTFLVISCPCALVLSVPLTFFAGIGAASKQGILFKSGSALETLSKVKAVVLDKTGTLTEGNFVVHEVRPVGSVSQEELLAICAQVEMDSNHPIANSIVTAAVGKDLELKRPFSVEEITGEGLVGHMPQGVVLCGNKKLMERYQIQFESSDEHVFGTEVFVAVANKYWGRLVLSDTLKVDAAEAVAAIKKQGIFTAMLTGDAKDSAEAIAREINIDQVSAKLLPDEKIAELRLLRQKYGVVMYVGDGLNDAPVLAGADIGVAMGSGADAAMEAADAVFMNSQMASIPWAISLAKKTSKIAWQNIVFALSVKIFVMLIGLLGFASMWLAVFADSGVALLCVLNALRLVKN